MSGSRLTMARGSRPGAPAACRVCGKVYSNIGSRNRHERKVECSSKYVTAPHTELLTSIGGESVTIVKV